jgi:two-component system chemotaxis response regulator CheB
VSTAQDGETVARGHVYIAPTDHHLLVIDEVIRLGRGPRENMARPAIDPLFRSVAANYGSRVIAVVLTGFLNDGTAGLGDVKRCGGLAVVQNPADAEAVQMPLSALQAADVDYRAPASELGALLTALTGQPAPEGPAPTRDLLMEIEIALGRPGAENDLVQIADPVALSCPDCGGVLSQVKRPPLRFRCQVGHGYTGEALAAKQEDSIDEAMRIAVRILKERKTLTEKLAGDARRNGYEAAAKRYESRVAEYQTYVDRLLRAAVNFADSSA